MRLDVPTLIALTVFVAALVGSLLLFTWWQNRRISALASWATSFGLFSLATILVTGRDLIPAPVSIVAGNAAFLLAAGMFWRGARMFEHRSAPPSAVGAGAALWIAACGIPDFYHSAPARVALGAVLTAAYTVAIAAEIWRGRSETLRSRYPLIAALLLHAATVLSRIPLGDAVLTDASPLGPKGLPWLGFYALEGLVVTIVLAFLLLALAKERVELEQREMASLDPLTGVLNRRSLLARARDILDESRKVDEEVSLLLIDIDHFKRVNDEFGHGTGDEVLQALCAVAKSRLPANALFARLGGEEFACLLPGVSGERAVEVAERIRIEFDQDRLVMDGEWIRVTVSIGSASTADTGHLIEALLAAADLTLYRAKDGGRNRVVGLGPPASLTPAGLATAA